jgi:hypothetical protein
VEAEAEEVEEEGGAGGEKPIVSDMERPSEGMDEVVVEVVAEEEAGVSGGSRLGGSGVWPVLKGCASAWAVDILETM